MKIVEIHYTTSSVCLHSVQATYILKRTLKKDEAGKYSLMGA